MLPHLILGRLEEQFVFRLEETADPGIADPADTPDGLRRGNQSQAMPASLRQILGHRRIRTQIQILYLIQHNNPRKVFITEGAEKGIQIPHHELNHRSGGIPIDHEKLKYMATGLGIGEEWRRLGMERIDYLWPGCKITHPDNDEFLSRLNTLVLEPMHNFGMRGTQGELTVAHDSQTLVAVGRVPNGAAGLFQYGKLQRTGGYIEGGHLGKAISTLFLTAGVIPGEGR